VSVPNALATPEAFLKSLEASSSGRIQRAAIQFLSNSVSIEDVDGKADWAKTDDSTGVNGNANDNETSSEASEANKSIQVGQNIKDIQANRGQANEGAEKRGQEAAARSQGRQKNSAKMWKMKVEFNTIQAATQAISRLRVNGVNDLNNHDNYSDKNKSDNNDENQDVQAHLHLLAQRRGRGSGSAGPQSEAVTTVEARIVEPKEAKVDIEATGESNTATATDVEAHLVAVQPLSGFILDDNDHLLDFSISPWGKTNTLSPPLRSSQIDAYAYGGYGYSGLSPSMSIIGQYLLLLFFSYSYYIFAKTEALTLISHHPFYLFSFFPTIPSTAHNLNDNLI
jgi:hypothetical protein